MKLVSRRVGVGVLTLLGVMVFIAPGDAIDTNGLLLYMPMDEGTGDRVKDVSGNGNDGTLKGKTKWVEGKVNKALMIDGDGHVEVPHNNLLNIKRDFTIELWANMSNFPDIWCSFVTMPDSYMLHIDAEGGGGKTFKWEPLVWSGGLDAWRTGANVVTPLNEWVHIAGVYDGKEYRSYVNGEMKGAHNRQGDIDVVAAPLVIGKDNRGCCSARRAIGVLDEVRIWTRVLSEKEINEIVEGGLAVEARGRLAITWGDIKLQ